MSSGEKNSLLTMSVSVPANMQNSFADWQSKLNAIMIAYPGFVSLEFSLIDKSLNQTWSVIQRFKTEKEAKAWLHSEQHHELLQELVTLLGNAKLINESVSDEYDCNGITEVFVTEVFPGKEKEYRDWTSKIHQIEAKFPGFKGVYVQSPTNNGRHWITFLQFDSIENLECWLKSPEREEVLKISTPLIANIENHRVVTPFSGWFQSLAKTGDVPPVWKQTMIVLLVLFPIVMLEIKYFFPFMTHLNLSVATFIGNALSVSLVSFPMMPIAIALLGWWLSPTQHLKRNTIIGTILVIVFYLIEILLFS